MTVLVILADTGMVNKIFEHILDTLKSVDFWIALSALAAGLICWRLIGTRKKCEKEVVLRRQIGVALVIAVIAAATFLVNHFVFLREPVFSKDSTGIVVMRIVGDDALDSLRGDLVEKLNAELQKEAAGQQIEIRVSNEMLDENDGFGTARKRARTIGQLLNAKLVIWGRKIGDKKFYPRITIMGAPEDWSTARERTHDVQSITELHLPAELVDEPFYLIQFAAGYSYYIQKDLREALPHFKAALGRQGASPQERADLQSFTAQLALGQRNMSGNVQEAIELLEKAAEVYEGIHQGKWARIQNNLGIAYVRLPTGNRAANLQKAIAAYEAALQVYTEKDFPAVWAMTQNNLGTAYNDLPTGDRAANLQKAIAAYEAALRVRTEKDFPADWAMTQNNLGNAYNDLPTGDRAANLMNAKVCFAAGLRVYTESSFPKEHEEAARHLADVEQQLRSQPSR